MSQPSLRDLIYGNDDGGTQEEGKEEEEEQEESDDSIIATNSPVAEIPTSSNAKNRASKKNGVGNRSEKDSKVTSRKNKKRKRDSEGGEGEERKCDSDEDGKERKCDSGDDDEERNDVAVEFEDFETAYLDALYGGATVTRPELICSSSSEWPVSPWLNLNASINAMQQERDKRRKERRHYQRPGRPFKDPYKAAKVLCTEEQRLVREKKVRLKHEWTQIRARWKKRKYDMRGEIDVGGTVERFTRRTIQEQQEKEQRMQSESPDVMNLESYMDSDGDAMMDKELNHDDSDEEQYNTSDEEQDDILKRLMAASDRGKANEKIKSSKDASALDTEHLPFAERLNFWEMGYSRPASVKKEGRRKEKYQQLKHQAQVRFKQQEEGDRDGEKLRRNPVTTLRKWHPFYGKKRLSSRYRFWPVSHNMYSNGRFTHQRQLLALAARYVMGGNAGSLDLLQDQQNSNICDDDIGTTEVGAMDNRFITALWNEELSASHRQRLLIAHSTDMGVNLQCFVQNQWKNDHNQRARVARHLGVTMDTQTAGPPDLLGHSLHPLVHTRACKSDRERLVRRYSVGKVNWASTQSSLSSATDDNENISDSGDRLQQQKLHRLQPQATEYVPVPGSMPPIPVLPLDITGIMFGPEDKYCQVLHKTWYTTTGIKTPGVDDVVYNLTLSSLLSRLVTAKLDGEDRIQQQLFRIVESMSKQAVDLSQSRVHNSLESRSPGFKLADANYYKRVKSYCNLVSNGYIAHESSTNDTTDVTSKTEETGFWGLGDEAVDQQDNYDSKPVGINIVAAGLHDFCKEHIDHRGLELFAPLHVTFGLLCISKVLPKSAMEILAKPTDDYYVRTPLDIIRDVLEHLEENDLLADQSRKKKEVVSAAELEYALYQAGSIFRRCIERDPTEVNHYCWYIGVLAGGLLLCSGNQIGDGAHSCPSSYNDQDGIFQELYHENTFASKAEIASHEVRQMLPKFHELRQVTAKAFQRLLYLEKYQKSARVHLAIASFLHWREVIALVVGPSGISDNNSNCSAKDTCQQICKLHGRHVVQWALQENSPVSMTFLRRRKSSLGVRLNGLALALETDPSKKEHWQTMVQSLGPVGRSLGEKKNCYQSCLNADDAISVQHDLQDNEFCWSKGRREWWDSTLLQIPEQEVSNSIDLTSFCTALDKHFVTTGASMPQMASSVSSKNETQSSCLTWLENVISGLKTAIDAEKIYSIETRILVHDDRLPLTINEVIERKNSISQLERMKLPGGSGGMAEIISYKILILAHIYGVLHPGVERGLIILVTESWCSERGVLLTDSTAFRCLEWLYTVARINVTKTLHRKHVKEAKPTKPTKATYSQAMREAVKRGVVKFGGLKWAKIYKHYDVFRNDHRGRNVVGQCYLWMVKHGEIDHSPELGTLWQR